MNSRPSEFSIIGKYFAPLAGEGAFNLRDDAAEIIPTEGMSLVITQDAIAEGIHFFSNDAPDMIAKKALRVNLSDLAAKGAVPKYISLALGLAKSWNEEWIADFAFGLKEDCKTFDVELTGGDTFVSGDGFVISITAIGEMPKGSYISRLGASEEDVVYVTGSIGDGALGLLARRQNIGTLNVDENEYLKTRYLLPQPRVEFAKVIREFATASMDISDGLVGDLEKLCQASNVSASVEIKNIPLSKAIKKAVQSESKFLETALTGGDDYEILVTIKPQHTAEFEEAVSRLPFTVMRIGTISSGQGVKMFDTSGQVIEFEKSSYDHSGERN